MWGCMKKLTISLIALFIFSCGVYAAEQKEEKEVFGRTIFKLDYPDRDVRVVLFSILQKDPLESYKEKLKKMRGFLLNKSKDRGKNKISSIWGDLFSSVSALEVGYLENSNSNNERVLDGETNLFQKQWLVTRVTDFNGKKLCWSVPFRPEKGKTVEVILTKDNVTDYKKLEKIYDSIVK